MIRRDRAGISAPRELTDPQGPGRRERAKVEKWIADGRPEAKRPKFSAYALSSVGVSLERLFAGKCAYCESPYTNTQPVDIEHWRPKSEVELTGDAQKRYGYEWLAADWTNLLPSCIDCNRARYIAVFESTATGTAAREILSGKGNQFPVVDETKRLRGPADPADQEVPLLLDPCRDDPDLYLRYREDGVVTARPDLGATERQRALASIRVFGLNRKPLVDRRHEHLLLLRHAFARVRALLNLRQTLAASVQADVKALLTDLIEAEIEQVRVAGQADRPYSGMSRQFAAEFLKELRPP